MTDSGMTPGDPELERRLRSALRGDVRFDAFTRGLYSTDASHYQIEPLGVVFPRSVADVEAVMEIARETGAPVLPRGGGTSQCGQTIGRAVVLDTSRYLTGMGSMPSEGDLASTASTGTGGSPASGASSGNAGRRMANPGPVPREDAQIEVETGVVLDHLNARLRPHGLWFPVDPSTGSRATLGGMAGNNSAGARSLRYGMMVDNVAAIEMVLPDGRRVWVGEGEDAGRDLPAEVAAMRSLYVREAEEIARRTPGTMRNVAGYNLHRLDPEGGDLAQLLVGSEGTLAFFSRLRLRLSPLPTDRVLGVCHFPDLVSALDAVQHLVGLGPSAVELVDENVLRLAADRPDYREAMSSFVRGGPGALLLVEFADGAPARPLRFPTGPLRFPAGPDREHASHLHGASSSGAVGPPDPGRALRRLHELMADLGHPGSVVDAVSPEEQAAVWSVRKAGLNIVMSMAGPRKPISFIEDCAVPLEHLAEYATSVEEIFRRHDTRGTWYAHASVGCLHVRPALNLKDPDDVARIRRIAEETHDVVRRLGGTHSGEHGDGILRSEFLETMLGRRMTEAFGEVKRTFDPRGLMNPGKIVDPPRMDDRSLFRYRPGYGEERPLPVVLDWSDSGGLLGAAERCNNNGACRKYDPGVMCPSFRVTHDERHSTRGRANALRLALTDQLGDDGLHGPEMDEAMSLCISCKGCRRECPTGVDMARMKLEWQHARNRRDGVRLRERVLASLPRMAPQLAAAAPLLDVLSRLPGRRLLGLAPQRALPRWHRRPWRDHEVDDLPDAHVVLFVDTFSRWFEPEQARAALRLLRAAGYRVSAARPVDGGRPLCCGRTYLSAGMLDEAREEAQRTVEALAGAARGGATLVSLEPSCLYTLKDELPALVPGAEARAVAEGASTLTELLHRDWAGGRTLPFDGSRAGGDAGPRRAMVHGHCHQKAFGGVEATVAMLRRVPGLEVDVVDSGCCGMAGAFGYHAEHYETSMAMAELDLLPAVRRASAETVVVADGTSCRAQIGDGAGRIALSSAVLLADALEEGPLDGAG